MLFVYTPRCVIILSMKRLTNWSLPMLWVNIDTSSWWKHGNKSQVETVTIGSIPSSDTDWQIDEGTRLNGNAVYQKRGINTLRRMGKPSLWMAISLRFRQNPH